MSSAKSFYKNTLALLIIQIVNYIFPLIIIRFLGEKLGIENYGIIAFALSIAQIGYIFTDYGFSLSATYSIAKHTNNKRFVNKTISAVLLIKTLILILVLIGLFLYANLNTKYAEYKVLFMLLSLTIVGQAYQPIWYFQAIEKMFYITLTSFFSRLFYLGTIFWFIQKSTDYDLVIAFNGISQIITAIIGMGIMIKMGYKFILPNLSFIKRTFSKSTEYFWSRAAVSTYTSCGAFFLGLFGTTNQVAYYSIAEQIYKAGQALFAPVSQALYPNMTKNKDFKLYFKTLKQVTIIAVIGCTFLAFTAEYFIGLVYGEKFLPSYPILVVFLITFCIITPSVLLGYPFLGALGYSNLANRSVFIAGGVQIIVLLGFYLLGIHTGVQIAVSILFVEIIVLILRAIWAKRVYTK